MGVLIASAVQLAWAVIGVAVAGCVALALWAGNLVICTESFSVQGFEPEPIREFPVLGPFADAVGLGDAPTAAVYALVLTAAMNFLVLAMAKLAAEMLQNFWDWREIRRLGAPGTEPARRLRDLMFKRALWLAPLSLAAFYVIRWDVAQFSIRQEALLLNTIDPSELLAWLPDRIARLGAGMAKFAGVSAAGYMACILGVAFAGEMAVDRMADRWTLFCRSLGQALRRLAGGESAEPALRGVPAAQKAPEIAAWTPMDTLHSRNQAAEGDGVDATPADFDSAGPDPAGKEPRIAPDRGRLGWLRQRLSRQEAGQQGRPFADSVPVAGPEVSEAAPELVPPVTTGARVDLVDVIAGPGCIESHPRPEVEGDPDRFCQDLSRHTWFLRRYYQEVVNPPERSDSAEEVSV